MKAFNSDKRIANIKRLLYFIRRLLFRNRIGEFVIVNLSNTPGGYQLSRKFVVPVAEQYANSFRKVSRKGILLQLNIANEVDHFIYFKYKDTTFDHLHDEIKSAGTIIDVGGNIGAFALFFEKLNTSASIHTFEPHPGLYKRLQQHLSLNASHIVAHNIGLGNKKERVRLYEVDERNPGMNRIFAAAQNHPYCMIDIDTLDNYWMQREGGKVDLIKIDVEGFELSALKGAKEILVKYHPILVIEIDDANLRNNNTTASALIQFLQETGYDCISTADKKRQITASENFANCHFDIVASSTSAIRQQV